MVRIYILAIMYVFVWICKGNLIKHYNSNRNPIQSSLFCIKAFNFFNNSNIVNGVYNDYGV